jgi:hypothetical protein
LVYMKIKFVSFFFCFYIFVSMYVPVCSSMFQ